LALAVASFRPHPSAPSRFCGACGDQLPSGVSFCPACGAAVC
jgi:predicted amidophosphoribosyltransferase